MVSKKLIQNVRGEELDGKRVLVRVDFNVPLSETSDAGRNTVVADFSRIQATIPTINFLVQNNAKIVLMSHLGRSNGKRDERLSLRPVADALRDLLQPFGTEIHFSSDCIGPDARAAIDKLRNGEVLLLENLRFYKEETANDDSFASQLSDGMDIFVNDAFGSAHRAHASTVGVTKCIQRKYAGFLMEKELAFLGGALQNPERPLAALVGGAKVSSKLEILQNLLSRVDKLLVGGGMVYTFYRALGYSVGDSIVEAALVPQADDIMAEAEQRGVPLILAPDSHIVPSSELRGEHKTPATFLGGGDTQPGSLAPEQATHTPVKQGLGDADIVTMTNTAEGPLYIPMSAKVRHIVLNEEIPEGCTAVDIGDEAVRRFCGELEGCKTVLWNGPMGICEREDYAHGTIAVMQCISDLTPKGTVTIVCGGETVAAVEREQHRIRQQEKNIAARLGTQAPAKQAARKIEFSHVSTGGGAALEFLEGKELPGVAALENVA